MIFLEKSAIVKNKIKWKPFRFHKIFIHFRNCIEKSEEIRISLKINFKKLKIVYD